MLDPEIKTKHSADRFGGKKSLIYQGKMRGGILARSMLKKTKSGVKPLSQGF